MKDVLEVRWVVFHFFKDARVDMPVNREDLAARHRGAAHRLSKGDWNYLPLGVVGRRGNIAVPVEGWDYFRVMNYVEVELVRFKRFAHIFVLRETLANLRLVEFKELYVILRLVCRFFEDDLAGPYAETKVGFRLDCLLFVFFLLFLAHVFSHLLLLLPDELVVLYRVVLTHVVQHFPVALHLLF